MTNILFKHNCSGKSPKLWESPSNLLKLCKILNLKFIQLPTRPHEHHVVIYTPIIIQLRSRTIPSCSSPTFGQKSLKYECANKVYIVISTRCKKSKSNIIAETIKCLPPPSYRSHVVETDQVQFR